MSTISNTTGSMNIGTQPYIDSKPDIRFETGDKGDLTVVIQTKDLEMKSVTQKNLPDYIRLFSDPTNMEKYREGDVWSADQTKEHVNTWINLWQNGNAFSAFAITNRNEDDQFIGSVLIKAWEPADSWDSCIAIAIGRVLYHKYWGKGLGKQVAIALVNYYIPEALDRGYKLPALSGETPKNITLTAREDNHASVKTWKSLGLPQVATIERFGRERLVFSETIEKLDKRNLPVLSQ